MTERCYICGGSTYHASSWNGLTGRTFCNKPECMKHFYDDEPADGQMILDAWDDAD